MSDTLDTIQQDEQATDVAEHGAEGSIAPTEKLVPVTESIRYRRRAQAAEQKLADLQTQFEQLNEALGKTQEELAAVERRQKIDQLLVEADAIDLQAARLLTEATIEQMDEADVTEVVDDLRRHKPYLFRQRVLSGGSLSPRPRHVRPGVNEAAEAAINTGDRRDLLRYLRLRRTHS